MGPFGKHSIATERTYACGQQKPELITIAESGGQDQEPVYRGAVEGMLPSKGMLSIAGPSFWWEKWPGKGLVFFAVWVMEVGLRAQPWIARLKNKLLN